jgi:hypothetical protein
MPLVIPKLDDRDYSGILREAMTRISIHNPEWTNFNDSDPGITLLQLFAFMTENLQYRSNLIPERNRLKFLTLLGLTLRAATAAQGIVTITNERGPLQAMALPPGLPVYAGKVGFVTKNGLDVLPIEMLAYYRKPLSDTQQLAAQSTYGQLYSTFQLDPSDLEFYDVVPFLPPVTSASIPLVNLTNGVDTVDGSLWMALLSRPGESALSLDVLNAIRGRTITLGMMPAVQDASRTLFPGGAGDATQPTLQFSIATGTLQADQPLYQDLPFVLDANPLQNLTLAQITIPSSATIGLWDQLAPLDGGTGDFPPTLQDPTIVGRLLTWIRLRLKPNVDSAAPASATAAISWIGINATRVTQQIQVIAEPLGTGTGEPDQSVRLANTPVITSTIQLTVNGEPWLAIDDLLAAPPEVPVRDPALPPGAMPMPATIPTTKVYVPDEESGVIAFGTGLHGMRPPVGAPILASYAYGGGAVGNVGIGSIQNSPQLPAGFLVENPLPTWGGDDGESVSDAERHIPNYLKNGDRAVSRQDFIDIVSQTPGIALGRVEVLALFSPDNSLVMTPGAMTLLVIPNAPGAPEPDLIFLNAICDFLEPRRLVTTELYVRGPQYVGVSVSVGIEILPGRDIATVTQSVRTAIQQYLSPIAIGSNAGWPLAKPVDPTGILVQALRVDGVSDVNGVLLWDSSSASIPQLSISGLQLPQLLRLSVTTGAPQDVTALDAPPSKQRLPVPMLQTQC